MKSALINEINIDDVKNKHLKELIFHLKKRMEQKVEALSIVPETAQQWNHHTDHNDYTAHKDTGGPSHGDYCD